jgi:SrtB family sortase
LYGIIHVPRTAYDEITADGASETAAELGKGYAWVKVADGADPIKTALYRQFLHEGEAEALALAMAASARGESALLVMDDAAAKKHARASLLPVTGTLGVIHRAGKEGLLEGVSRNIKPVIDNLKSQGIHVDDKTVGYFKAKPKPKRKKMSLANRVITHTLTLAIIVLSVFLVRELFNIGNYHYDLWENRRINAAANAIMADDWMVPRVTVTDYAPIESPDSFTNMRDVIIRDGASINEIYLAMPPELPRVREPHQDVLNLIARFNNPDIIGFFRIPSELEHMDDPWIANGPLVQGRDNDYYLHRTPERTRNAAGSLFIDFRNSPHFTDHNTIVYGHAMKDRSMFGNLFMYNRDFAQVHDTIIIMTRYDTTRWRIFAGYTTTVDRDGSFYYINPNFRTREEHQVFLDEIQRRARIPWSSWGVDQGLFFFNNVSVTPDDIIVTLSTCTNVHDDQRLVIHAVLVERW